MFKSTLHIILLVMLAINTRAQITSEKVQGGAVISVKSNGVYFSDASNNPSFSLPEFDGKHLAGFGSFWISALNKDGKVFQTASKSLNTPEFWSGPMDTFTRKSKSPGSWNKVWTTNRSEIELHRKNYQQNNYSVPASIAQWPGNSSPGEALPAILAPYYDWNADGKYTPAQGDYPFIQGTQATYTMYNDEYGEHAASQSVPLKAQIQQLTYNLMPGVSNAFILEAYVKNMSDETWMDAYFGFYTDLLLGNPDDNYAATLADRNLVIGYNGDISDEGPNGFGASLPYYGVGWLNQKMNSSMIFQETGTFRNFNNAAELRQVMTGNLTDSSLKHGKSRFAYPGNSDLNNTGQPISEESSANNPGKRNILNVAGPFQIPANGFIKLELAVYGGVSFQPDVAAKEHWDKILNFYQSNLSNRVNHSSQTRVYPNPINSGRTIFIQLTKPNPGEIKLFDSEGKLIMTQIALNEHVEFNTEGLKPGVYVLRVQQDTNAEIHKLFIIN